MKLTFGVFDLENFKSALLWPLTWIWQALRLRRECGEHRVLKLPQAVF